MKKKRWIIPVSYTHLTSDGSVALLQVKDNSGNWITVLDLLNDITLSTDRNNPCLLYTSKAMQIGEPLLKSAPIFTSWYVIGILILILHFLYLFIYDLKVNKVGLKEIFTLS